MRRLLLALVLALLTVGCVQITNPQFDERYRYHAEPLQTNASTYSVFALHSFEGTTPVVEIVVVNVGKRTVTASITVPGVRALTDLGPITTNGGPKLLATTATGFAEVDVGRRTVDSLPASLPPDSRPAGVAYDRGARLLWGERPRAADILRRPSALQTATLDLRKQPSKRPVLSEVGPLYFAGSASTGEAYFVGSQDWWSASGGWGETVWKADFGSHTASLVATPASWPDLMMQLPDGRFDRPIARYGVPSEDGTRAVVFTSVTDPSSRVVFVDPGTRTIFEPDGDRYLVSEFGLRSPENAIDVRVTERSLAQPAYSRVVLSSAGSTLAVDALGVVGDVFAYARSAHAPRGLGTRTLAELGGMPGDRFELVLRDLSSGSEAAVLKLHDFAVPEHVDYLGSYTR